MKRNVTCLLVLACGAAALTAGVATAETAVEARVTNEELSRAHEFVEGLTFAPESSGAETVIAVDADQRFQSILGIGAWFEHSTGQNLAKMDPGDRAALMERLVHPKRGIGMNLMRLCIGTSDFTGTPWYSYNDLPYGETDPGLEQFSIERDQEYILPMIRLARDINPELLFYASPWSPPGWMKDTGAMTGGCLLREHYETYAAYLVKYVQAYEAEGAPIHALTPQNEPGVDNPAYPSCQWTAEEQRVFVRDYLGPALDEAGLETKLWIFDHNFNRPEFPRTILSDPEAAQYVDGVGWHFYEGTPEAMGVIQEEFPDKHQYFTEGSTFGTTGALQIVSFFRNWARSYNAWVILLDEHQRPNNGPFIPTPTPVILDSETREVSYHFDYYMYGHFSKWTPRGAERVYTPESERDSFGHVAFVTPAGEVVLHVVNASEDVRAFEITWNGRYLASELGPESIATYRWAK